MLLAARPSGKGLRKWSCTPPSKLGLKVQQQTPLQVVDEDGTVLGEFVADLIVEDILLIELKACRTLADEHVAQLLGYLRSSPIQHGLLVNFGGPKLQIKKFADLDSYTD